MSKLTQFKPLQTVVKKTIPINSKKYGVTEYKKAELDELTLEVVYAQIEVNQYQAIVDSLTVKVNNYLTYMNIADQSRTQAMNNKTLVDQLTQNAKDLQKNSNIMFDDMSKADDKTKQLSLKIKELINKLIFSAEMLNRLGIMIVRQKAINPLISDDLVSRVNKAGSDANNAVALTLTALNSTFACEASNMESEAATALEYYQSINLLESITGMGANGKPTEKHNTSLRALLHRAYKDAKTKFDTAQTAWTVTVDQLNHATLSLSNAQIKLQSLQSGLAAGNAAALAS